MPLRVGLVVARTAGIRRARRRRPLRSHSASRCQRQGNRFQALRRALENSDGPARAGRRGASRAESLAAPLAELVSRRAGDPGPGHQPDPARAGRRVASIGSGRCRLRRRLGYSVSAPARRTSASSSCRPTAALVEEICRQTRWQSAGNRAGRGPRPGFRTGRMLDRIDDRFRLLKIAGRSDGPASRRVAGRIRLELRPARAARAARVRPARRVCRPVSRSMSPHARRRRCGRHAGRHRLSSGVSWIARS